MRRKREQHPIPWLKLFFSATAVGVLGVVGYQIVNEGINAEKHPTPAVYDADDLTFPDLSELADSLEEDELFVPRFLLSEVPQMFINSLPDVCALTGEIGTFSDLLSATPEQTLQANGYGDTYGDYVFSLYANRTNCQNGTAGFRLSFNRGRQKSVRLVFSDDELGRQSMLSFLEERFRTLNEPDMPDFAYLRLTSSKQIPPRQLAQLRRSHPEDPVSQELERLTARLFAGSFDQNGIGNFRIVYHWSRAYFSNNFQVPPNSVTIEMTFTGQEVDFFDRTVFINRSGGEIILSGTESQSEWPLDAAEYPALYAFLGGEETR